MDRHSKEARSYNMSRIHNKDTKPEETVRKYLFSQGLRFRKNVKTLPGTPDIVFPKYKTLVFVNGCFWHKHEACSLFVWPDNNKEFWENKLKANSARDIRKKQALERLGWRVLIIWECELLPKAREKTLKNLYSCIINQEKINEESKLA
jgi:DNA mismatch endonuclease, patch repair protein